MYICMMSMRCCSVQYLQGYKVEQKQNGKVYSRQPALTTRLRELCASISELMSSHHTQFTALCTSHAYTSITLAALLSFPLLSSHYHTFAPTYNSPLTAFVADAVASTTVSLITLLAFDAASAAQLILINSPSLGFDKSPFHMREKAMSKRAPIPHATRSWGFVS